VEHLVPLLLAAGAQVVSPIDAQPGDIVVQGAQYDSSTGQITEEPTADGGMNHIGICMTGECTEALSNGNSVCSVTAVSPPSFSTLSSGYGASTPYVILDFP